MSVNVIVGDMRDKLAELPDESVHCIITDPPYGQTSLAWDRWPDGWPSLVRRVLHPTGSMWVFGMLRMFMERADEFAGWALAQDVIWEKHNGSNPFADRFRRVHEQAAHFYRSDAPWSAVYKAPLFTNDATARAVRRKRRPPQWGHIEASAYRSEDGGPRLMRSVLFCRSEHGVAEHPTQKPLATILPLLAYSCPPKGVVLDPFLGSGTVAVAAQRLQLHCTGIELNPEYAEMARCRIRGDAGLFAQTAAE